MADLIDRQSVIDAITNAADKFDCPDDYHQAMKEGIRIGTLICSLMPPAQPTIIQCKDCKHNPKESWFGCPMSHLSEEQRPGTAWCWRAERREDDHETD